MAINNIDIQDDKGNSYRPMANPDSITDFTKAGSRANIASGDSFRTAWGKICKFFADLGTSAFSGLANNLTTTASGYGMDARQGPVIQQKFDQINSDLSFPDGVKFYPDVKDGIRGYNTDAARGADTFVPFRSGGITLLGKYTAISTYDLSGVKGYKNLIVDDFLCVSSTGGTSGSKYENDSNGTIQLSIGYTAPQLSYVASTGILTITPALLSGSAFHNPATATASGYLQTSVYLINK